MKTRILRVVMLLCLGLSLASCGTKVNPLLVASWEVVDKNRRCSVEFTKDGKVILFGDTALLKDFQFVPKMLADFNLQIGASTPITYKAINATQMEIQGDYTAMLESLSAGGKGDASNQQVKEAMDKLKPREIVTYAVSGQELTITSAEGKYIKLKRVQ